MSEETLDLSEVTVEVIGETAKGTDFVMKIGGEEVQVSRQIFDDQFNYDSYKCIQPPYNFDALLYFFENNTWHARCCRLKAACTVGLGYAFPLRHGMEANPKELVELVEFFDNCNNKETFIEIMEKFLIDYEATGNAYLEIARNLAGKITSIYHIPAHTMRVRADRDGFVQLRDTRYVFYKQFGDDRVWNTKGELAPNTTVLERANEVINFIQYSPRTTYYGVPEWLPSIAAMFGSEKAADFNVQFFENNAVPQFAIIVKKAKLGSDVKTVIANYFKKEIKGKNHKTLVLEVPGEGELEMKELAKDTKDSSFRLYRLDNRDEVITAHGVPPRMVGIISSGQLGGAGDATGQKEAFLTQIIAPRQARLNHRINKLLIANGIGAKSYRFELEKLNATDDEKDSQIYERYIKIGVYSINQVLDKLREPRIEDPGANEHFIYTTSGPILVSKLQEYMEMALIPDVPELPAPPGTSEGEPTSQKTKRADIGKMFAEILKMHEDLQKLTKGTGGETIETNMPDKQD